MSDYTDGILKCIREAEDGVLVEAPKDVVTGFAGDKLTGLIQRITRFIGTDYIEVGVFQGSSLLNTAFVNPGIHCYGIDNFSQFDLDNRNKSLVQERAGKLGVTNFTLIDKDFEEGLREFSGKVGTFFIDGPHDYRSQLMCLAYGTRILAEKGVMIVDDANYAHVRQATADFLYMHPEYKLVFETYTPCHPSNMTPAQLADAKAGWWDGAHLIVHDPENEFEPLMPQVPDNARFIRDHHVHIARYGPVATEAAMLLETVPRPWKWPKGIVRYAKALRERRQDIQHRFHSCNTDSEDLPPRIGRTRPARK
jgi:hypothetical protein